LKAEEYMQQGNLAKAHQEFSIAVDITPEMAFAFV
jgi:Tfp pilus assembly protein PilF